MIAWQENTADETADIGLLSIECSREGRGGRVTAHEGSMACQENAVSRIRARQLCSCQRSGTACVLVHRVLIQVKKKRDPLLQPSVLMLPLNVSFQTVKIIRIE